MSPVFVLAATLREAAPFFVTAGLALIGALFAALGVRIAEAEYTNLRQQADKLFSDKVANELGAIDERVRASVLTLSPDANVSSYPSLDARSLSAPAIWMGDVASLFPGLVGPIVAVLLLHHEISDVLLYIYLGSSGVVVALVLVFLLYVKPGNYPKARIQLGRRGFVPLWKLGPFTPGVLLLAAMNIVAAIVALNTA